MPPKPDNAKGIKGWLMGLTMKRAGAGMVSANRITQLGDTDGDGVVNFRAVLLEGLNFPFGMASPSRIFMGQERLVPAPVSIFRDPVQTTSNPR